MIAAVQLHYLTLSDTLLFVHLRINTQLHYDAGRSTIGPAGAQVRLSCALTPVVNKIVMCINHV